MVDIELPHAPEMVFLSLKGQWTMIVGLKLIGMIAAWTVLFTLMCCPILVPVGLTVLGFSGTVAFSAIFPCIALDCAVGLALLALKEQKVDVDLFFPDLRTPIERQIPKETGDWR